MDYQLTIIQKPTYLHAVVNGVNTKENVLRYLEALGEECMSRKCFRMLIEEHLEGPRIDMLKVFSIAAQGSNQVVGLFNAIAYVDCNAVGNLMQFAETVARNRGLPIAVFANVADAEKWLLNKDNKI